MGVHVMNHDEIYYAARLLNTDYNQDMWSFVVIPLPMLDVHENKIYRWQHSFNRAKDLKITPIVRLMTRFCPELDAWEIPTRADIMSSFAFLSNLEWPNERKFIIVYNETNHAAEWAGNIDPEEYARILRFTALWARSEDNDFRILPAAMDLAAPNLPPYHMEAFTYLNRMIAYDPYVFDLIDYWNSHSYPNPAFSSPPTARGQNSLRGFIHELDWLKEKTGLERRVFITETGWDVQPRFQNRLMQWYSYAVHNIWNDERVVAVIPFVLRGDPGPFSGFTLLDRYNNPTLQYIAFRSAILSMDRYTTDVVW
jgi:hypothetical protein